MVKIDYFDIQFEAAVGQSPLFLAGHSIRGSIVLKASEPLPVTGIFISLFGEAKTSWVNKVSDKIYETVETYVNDRLKVPYAENRQAGSTVIDGLIALSPGSHNIPFTLHLPLGLPSSYDGDFGYIRYKLSASLQTSKDFEKELISEKLIYVLAAVRPEHLTKNHNAQMAIGAEESFDIVECCSARGNVHMSLSHDKSYCAVGRPFAVDVNVSNRTRSKKTPTLLLLQEAYFQSKSRYESVNDAKTLLRVVESVILDVVDAGKSSRKQVVIQVPHDLPPTTPPAVALNGGTLITLKYKLKLDVGNNFELILPIGVVSLV